MKILINLIGGQPAPVYIATRIINPDKVLFVYSKDSKLQLHRIINTLSGYNYDSLDVNPYDLEDCYKKLLHKLNEYSSDELIVNLTSGTKIMSFAAFKIFSESNLQMIYIDSQNHTLITLSKNNKVNSSPLNLIFGIKDYFSLYGYLIESGKERFPKNEAYEKLNLICSKYYMQMKNIITVINKQTKENNTMLEAVDNSGQCYLRYDYKKSKGILKITQGRDKIEAKLDSPEMISYISGFWFEDLIFNKIMKSGIFDEILKNVKIYLVRENLQPEYLNEFDIVAIRNQTLYIFECKTGNIDKVIIEKLRLIKSITGTYSKIFLISLFRPTNTSVIDRINDFNIQFVNFTDINKFFEDFKIKIDINPNL